MSRGPVDDRESRHDAQSEFAAPAHGGRLPSYDDPMGLRGTRFVVAGLVFFGIALLALLSVIFLTTQPAAF
jgi:hypothetical protein